MDSQRTALYALHEKLNAKIVDFHGWLMPVQYSSIIHEHNVVRKSAGLFDVSHMGEFIVEGFEAEEFLQWVVAGNVKRLIDGQCLYTPMCYDNGTIVDDLLIYRHNSTKYMVVVNASNIEKDFDWMVSNTKGMKVDVRNESEQYALLALQGPKATQCVNAVLKTEFDDLKYYHFRMSTYDGSQIVVSRTGYTGEDGYEIYVAPHLAEKLFEEILAIEQVEPAGLGCRDTLRFEARLPLYGNELTDQVTPLDTGLKRFVDLEGDSFIGQKSLQEQAISGANYKLYGLEMIDKGIARNGVKVYALDSSSECGDCLGEVTSGSFCPSLNKNCALALLKPKSGKPGTQVLVEIRGKFKKAKLVKTPFYKRINQ